MSEVGDLAFVVNDGVLSDPYQIIRSTGSFILGGWTTSEFTISGFGVISVASEEDLEMIPEGDRVGGMLVFHSELRIYETQLDLSVPSSFPDPTSSQNIQRVSDKIIFNNSEWRILAVWPYNNRNYWKAVGCRLGGI